MIEQERIDAIKSYVDVAPFMQACGIDLKQTGKGYKGHCPFHDDKKTPSLSVTPSVNLWKCFGCGKGGDIIEFVQHFDQVTFKEAVKKLATYLPTGDKAPPEKPKAKPAPDLSVKDPVPLSVADKKLLTRVVAYYQHTLSQDTRGLGYLKERGIT